MANFSGMKLKELEKAYTDLIRKANQKLYVMEKREKKTQRLKERGEELKGDTKPTYAYYRTASTLEKEGLTRFPKTKTLDKNQLVHFCGIAEKYINSSTFSLQGQNEYYDRVFSTLTKNHGNGSKISRNMQHEIGKIFKSDSYKKITELLLSSSQVAKLFVPVMQGNTKNKADEISEIFNDYMDNIDRFANINDLEDFFYSRLDEKGRIK